MKKLAAFCALPNRDRVLLIEAVTALVFFGMALRLVSVERLRAWAGSLRPGNGSMDRIVWAVRTSARRVPGATCLSSALALQRMLSRRGYASELHIGVAWKDKDFAAHAWLVRGERVLIGEQERGDYMLLATWSAADLPGRPGQDDRHTG